MKSLVFLGITLITIGFIIVVISSFLTEKTNLKGGGIIFLGPIPLTGFASDKKTFYLLFGLGILLFTLSIIFRRFF